MAPPGMTQGRLDTLLRSACEQASQLPLSHCFQMDLAGRCEAPAACWADNDGLVTSGDCQGRMTLMSTIKPFLLLHLLETKGAEVVDSWVGDLPSSKPYWSLKQLRDDGGQPRNAMINSGAMLLASKLTGSCPSDQQAGFLEWLAQFCPPARLAMDEACLAQALEPDGDPHNFAIARELEGSGRIRDAATAFEIYFRLCCLSGSVIDIALLGHALNSARPPDRDRVLRTMMHSGLYESSSDWFSKTGLPAKSGVSGVIFGVWPGAGCLAACGEWLDESGNPLVPQLLLQDAAEMLPPMNLKA